MKTIEQTIDTPGYRGMVGKVPETVDEARTGRLIGKMTLGNCRAFAEVYVLGWVHPETYVSVVAYRQCEEPKLWNFQLREDDVLLWGIDGDGNVAITAQKTWQDREGIEEHQLFWSTEVRGFQFNIR